MKKCTTSSDKNFKNKVYKQMKDSELEDKKVHKGIAKMLKHEKQEHKAGVKGDKKLHEMAEKRHEKKHDPKKPSKAKAKVEKVMKEFKEGKLHSGSKKGPEVTNPKQAIAIALSESRKVAGKKSKKK
jgi:hypothetical protein